MALKAQLQDIALSTVGPTFRMQASCCQSMIEQSLLLPLLCTKGVPQLTEILMILMSSSGFSLYVFAFSILWTTSSPCTARPNTVCLLSNHGARSVVMKNWEAFVFGPALAILSVYGLSCFKDENSSSNSLPQMLSPPVPSPSGSPP